MNKQLLGSVLVGILVTACGGGGGGGGVATTPTGPREPLAITSANAPQASAVALDGSDSLDGVGGNTPINLLSTTADAGDAALTPASFAYAQMLRLPAYVAGRTLAPAAVYGPETLGAADGVCDLGGSVSVTIDTASGTLDDFQFGTPAPGSSIAMTFSNCNDSSIGTTVNGGLKMTFTQATGVPGVPGVDVFLLRLDIVFTSLVFAGQFGADGDMALITDSDGGGIYAVTLSGTELEVTDNARTVALYNYFESAATADNGANLTTEFDFQVDDSLLSGSITVVSLEPFKIALAETYPNSGRALITGAGGSTVTVEVLDSVNVRLHVDANGDAVAESVIDATWAELDALVENIF